MISPLQNWRSILLIRHGATALNSDDHTVDRIRGWSDWPLSQQGWEEAARLAGSIIINPPSVLLCSNLTRARQTAEIIAESLGYPFPEMSAGFLPWNVGEFVGRKASEVVPILAHYATKLPYQKVPGGESFNSFRVRFFKGLLNALRFNEGTVGIVTHHRNERLLKAWAKLNYPEGGSFDDEEFTRKGETTGHCELIQIPLDRLACAVELRSK